MGTALKSEAQDLCHFLWWLWLIQLIQLPGRWQRSPDVASDIVVALRCAIIAVLHRVSWPVISWTHSQGTKSSQKTQTRRWSDAADYGMLSALPYGTMPLLIHYQISKGSCLIESKDLYSPSETLMRSLNYYSELLLFFRSIVFFGVNS